MRRTIDRVLGDGPQIGTSRYDLQGRCENAAFEYAAGWLVNARASLISNATRYEARVVAIRKVAAATSSSP